LAPQSTLTVLIKRFTSESTRVMRLEGMFAEYDGKVQEALESYDEILKKDPVNSVRHLLCIGCTVFTINRRRP